MFVLFQEQKKGHASRADRALFGMVQRGQPIREAPFHQSELGKADAAAADWRSLPTPIRLLILMTRLMHKRPWGGCDQKVYFSIK